MAKNTGSTKVYPINHSKVKEAAPEVYRVFSSSPEKKSEKKPLHQRKFDTPQMNKLYEAYLAARNQKTTR